MSPPATAPTSPRRSRKGWLIALIVVLVLAALTTIRMILGPGVSKPIYIFRADAACGEAAGDAAPAATRYPELAAASAGLATAVDAHIRQLGVVMRPKGADGLPVEGITRALGATRDAARRLETAANASDDAGTRTATQDLAQRFIDADSQSTAYGFTECGTGLAAATESTVGGSQAVLKTLFVSKAEDLCRAAASQEIREPRNDTPREIGRYFNEEAALFDKLLADLRALPVPPADDVEVSEMLGAQEAVNTKARQLGEAAVAQDIDRFLAAQDELDPLITAADAKLDAYGLPTCGSNFGNV